MTATLLAISAGYVVLSVLLLWSGIASPLRWWIKAAAIVVVSAFFVEDFYATGSLLGWPGRGRLPARFQLLWTRVVEPDPKLHDPGAIFLWVEEVDENNVPLGTPRSYRVAYSKPLEDKVLKARDEIMSGNPQEGTAEDVEDNQTSSPDKMANLPEGPNQQQTQNANNVDLTKLVAMPDYMQNVEFKPLPRPLMPPKP
jgi:hypothetical protein